MEEKLNQTEHSHHHHHHHHRENREFREHGHHEHHKSHGDTKTLKVLKAALAFALLSTVLITVGSPQAGITALIGKPGMWIMSMGHLAGAIGTGTLLWFTVKVYVAMSSGCDRYYALYVVTTIAVLYHLCASLGCVLNYAHGLYLVTMVMWWLRMFSSVAFFSEAFLLRDGELRLTGLLIVLAFAATCPYALSGGWGVVQWWTARCLAILLALQLYRVISNSN